jgi:hypothetical protein
VNAHLCIAGADFYHSAVLHSAQMGIDVFLALLFYKSVNVPVFWIAGQGFCICYNKAHNV